MKAKSEITKCCLAKANISKWIKSTKFLSSSRLQSCITCLEITIHRHAPRSQGRNFLNAGLIENIISDAKGGMRKLCYFEGRQCCFMQRYEWKCDETIYNWGLQSGLKGWMRKMTLQNQSYTLASNRFIHIQFNLFRASRNLIRYEIFNMKARSSNSKTKANRLSCWFYQQLDVF